ncbi:hypothetical protein MAR_022367 [Mya arenaria]|uniref:Uncharacterized protein n=1 Tax=Mya arenaria TaxID=6604 RepID=A0ABY7DJW8_MYAAR|nr:hypothetical protein MAR_022367 [Mya arenaria]
MDNKGEMKNDLHQRAFGVHMPAETTSREIASQRSAMSDGKLSKTGRPVNLHGFNNIPSLEKTQDAENAQMSSGGHLSNESTCSKNDNESPSASARTHTLVVVQTPGYQQVLEDEKGKLKVWPYSDIDNPDKVPVTLHKAKRGIHLSVSKGMSEKKSRMTVFQSAEHSAEKPEGRMVNKYKTSSVLSGDGSMGGIMKTHGESVQSVLLQDANGNALSEEELSALLPKIAETISKLDSTETEEILPGITQNITKLKNGGNLVITTMTRRVDEEETSSGHGSPVPDHPVLDVDDLEKNSKGEFYYVEDVTSESQESAYFSNSRNTSESVQPLGGSGIEESTAAEILSAMYGGSGLQELEENEEEWSDRTYEYDFPRNGRGYSKDRFVTPYMVEEPNTLPRINESTNEKYESSYRNSGGEAFVYGGGLAQSYSQMTHGVVPVDDTSSLQSANVQNTVSGGKTIERYTFESETTEFPPAVPVSLPPQLPPALDYADNQFSMMKVDMAPKMQEERIPIKYKPLSESEPERPIYKTVATIQTKVKEPPPPKKEHKEHIERKKYKIVSSKATEEQESHMRFDDFDYNFHTENVEYKVSPIEREPEQPRQSLTELLLSRLSRVDRKHIRQTIDVKHDHQDIYGDPRFMHADGETSYGTAGTSNFDTVGEKVDLILKGGKAFITVIVTAERVTPVDIEFNVWRKNQAIVTRVIEVDLLATEQRRRLYYKVMESPTGRSHGAYSSTGQHETVLDSYETLELFTKILGAADGEGDTETTEVKTRYGRTTRPLAPDVDLLY